MTEAELEIIKDKVARAETIMDDMEKLDDMINFLGSHNGTENNGVRLEIIATYYTDDCLNGSGIIPPEEHYHDANCNLGNNFSEEIIKMLERCRGQLKERFDKLKV